MIKVKEVFNTENEKEFISTDHLRHRGSNIVNNIYEELCNCWGFEATSEHVLDNLRVALTTMHNLGIFTDGECDIYFDTALDIMNSKIKPSTYTFK